MAQDRDAYQVVLPQDLAERLKAAAHTHDRSVRAELRVALRAYLDMLDKRAQQRQVAA